MFFKEHYFRPKLLFVYTMFDEDKCFFSDEPEYDIKPDRDLLIAIRDGKEIYVASGVYNYIQVEFYDSDFNLVELSLDRQNEWAKLYTF
jgi:hypothetical protein